MSKNIFKFSEKFDLIVKNKFEKNVFIINSELKPKKITYNVLSKLINQALAFYQLKNLQKGDTIFSLMPNCIETIVLFLASIKGGFNYAPLSCTSSGQEILKWCDLVRPKLCVTTKLINNQQKDSLKNSFKTCFIKTDTKFEWLPQNEINLQTEGNSKIYLSTSGTTGKQKAIVIDANTLWSSGYTFANFHKLDGSNLRFWNNLPMSYLGGLFNLLLLPLSIGSSIVIDEPFSGKTFLKFWQTVERFDINSIWLLPSILKGLLKIAERFDENTLRNYGKNIKCAFLGTAPIDLESKKKFIDRFGFSIFENFALSETTFLTTETFQNIENSVEGSTGELLPYVDLKFKEVSIDKSKNKSFEIYAKTPFLFDGYLKSNGIVDKPFDKEGFFPTGDLGYLNKNNLLIITGRQRDIIKKGGYLIALREIEIFLETHPYVSEACAVKVPHTFYGETFLAYIILKNPILKNANKEINSYIINNIVRHKWPDQIIIKKSFPKTLSGKIKKHLLI